MVMLLKVEEIAILLLLCSNGPTMTFHMAPSFDVKSSWILKRNWLSYLKYHNIVVIIYIVHVCALWLIY